ncbi:PR-1-like protein [Dothidotthia symphoricarpi CBS 119687]|uniref:PR-1-like protein n=1 Tax=Dothidotthia symphoricarpi CBS 119687 TaxID=1392245 RepID=A0A6A6ASB9_9PLEO|nr:PR-1-like protein [Dothidotthia symphoricarpi CBS 119687]KAF2134048.1 PR-1-like protein [Dothidotthia symphoricarpi CBS 119687]
MYLVSLLFCLYQGATLISAQQQSSTDYTDDADFRDAILNGTNTYRKQHNATDLVWNDTLAEYANEWSQDCKFDHSNGPYGENLASGFPSASEAIVGWGEERVNYDFEKGDFSMDAGHFTQLVWKSTTQVGCSRTECNGGEDGGKGDAPGWYVVCEYSPSGNVIGEFVENVQEQVSDNE